MSGKTPIYAAPEVPSNPFQNTALNREKIDLYAAGLTFY